MALINCPECGKQISDRAISCPNCGCPIEFREEPYVDQNYYQEQTQPKKKQSVLGIIALIFSFIPYISIVGIVLANVDIFADKKSEKHTISKVALGISLVTFLVPIALNIFMVHTLKSKQFEYSSIMSQDSIDANANKDITDYNQRIENRYGISIDDSKNDTTDSTKASKSESVESSVSYESIYEDYKQKLIDATPALVEEFNAEAEQNQDGLDGLAKICNDKVGVLAKIDTDGTGEMASYMLKHGNGKYDEYESWSAKLSDVYTEQASLIQNAYTEYYVSH